jgi:hypothetical protein
MSSSLSVSSYSIEPGRMGDERSVFVILNTYDLGQLL